MRWYPLSAFALIRCTGWIGRPYLTEIAPMTPFIPLSSIAHSSATRYLSCFLLAVLPFGAPMQGQPEPEPEIYPSGTATLLDAGGGSAISVSFAPTGPLFALAPIAHRLGQVLEIGPLGESHTLQVENLRYLLGPDSPIVVVEDGEGSEELFTLRRAPLQTLQGLKVPLDFLTRTLGDPLGIDFIWDESGLKLGIEQRLRRTLTGRLLQVRQGPITTIEITFSAQPRYRIEREANELVVRFVADRVALEKTGTDDPMIEAIEIEPDFVRIRPALDMAVAEPRLLASPPRLILEVFRRTAVAEPTSRGRATHLDSQRSGLRTIVVDPGHGGSETGAIRNGLVEKDLTLWFARAFKQRLERRLPVRVMLTRDGDEEVPLESRTAFANQNKADLFISLHLNSWFAQGARGAETYFLSREASDDLAAGAAAFENQAGGGAQSDLQLILWDLAQSYHLAESHRFASNVQEELNDSLSLENRGVKQAPFRVLLGATMPAVVVELGFLSNPDEADRLRDPEYRSELVSALVRAVVRFRNRTHATVPSNEDAATEPAPSETTGHTP